MMMLSLIRSLICLKIMILMIKYSVMNINILRKKLHMPMMNRLTFMDGADLTDFTLESVIEIVNVLEGEAMMDRS